MLDIPAQVSSKIGVIESLIEKVDKIILGGGMIFTFFKARGLEVGSSLVEEDKLELAKTLEEAAKKKGACRRLRNCVIVILTNPYVDMLFTSDRTLPYPIVPKLAIWSCLEKSSKGLSCWVRV